MTVDVDHTFNAMTGGKTNPNWYGYNEGTTDHFITIVGRGITEDGKRYYRFYDPGTKNRKAATKEQNILVEEEPYHWVGKQPYTADGKTYKTYHLTMVILFKKDVVNFKEEIKDNIKREKDLKSDFNDMTGDFSQTK